MIVSEADSKTVECFCFGFGLDFVFLVNPTFILFKWQQARLSLRTVFHFDIFFPNQLHSPPARESGKEPVRGWNLLPVRPESPSGPWELWALGMGSGDRELFPGLVPAPQVRAGHLHADRSNVKNIDKG